jgi:PAS domain S-box-containing protein
MAAELALTCAVLDDGAATFVAEGLAPSAYVPIIGEDFLLQLGVIVEPSSCDSLVAACLGAEAQSGEVEMSDVADVIGDLANALAGELHGHLVREGRSATVGLPFFVRGRAWVSSAGDDRSLVLQFGASKICVVLIRTTSHEVAGRRDGRDKTRLLEMAIESRKAAEAFNRDLIANAPYAIISTDARGQIIAWNPRAERIFGTQAHDALGRKIADFLLSPEGETADPISATALRVGADDEVGAALEYSARHSDGSLVPVEVQMIATQREGRATFTAFIKDLTELKRAEREVHSLNTELVTVSRRAGMAEVAGEVLHNVGNVLNSVFVATRVMREELLSSRITVLTRLAALIEARGDTFPDYLAHDPRGRHVVPLIQELSRQLDQEHKNLATEVEALSGHVEHIAAVIGAQRRHVGTSGVYEMAYLREIVDSAIGVLGHRMHSLGVELVRKFEDVSAIAVDKHKLLQILINMIKNAVESVIEAKNERCRVTVEIRAVSPTMCQIVVEDNGLGIAPDHLLKIFSHGFTTKSYGSGFGLHASANAAKELGGSLSCSSPGVGKGARFTLELPRCVSEAANSRPGIAS